MRRTIRAQVIVEIGENSHASLISAVRQYLESKGFKIAEPHVYPEDPLVIEITETIPTITY